MITPAPMPAPRGNYQAPRPRTVGGCFHDLASSYRVRHYFTNSIWILPLLSMLARSWRFHCSTGSKRHWVGNRPSTRKPRGPCWGPWPSSMFTFIVFVCSALLVAVQLASANSRHASSPSCSGTRHQVRLDGVRFHLHLFPCRPGPHQHLCRCSPRDWPHSVAWQASASSLPDRPRGQNASSQRGLAGVACWARSDRKCLSAASGRGRQASQEPSASSAGSPPRRWRTSRMASSSRSTSTGWWPWPSVPTASSKWCRRLATSSRSGTLCFASFRAGRP